MPARPPPRYLGSINGYVDAVLARFGGIDLLINNAGIALGDLTFGEATEADFEKITRINYWGVIHTTQCGYPHRLARPEAAIVNLSSSQGFLARLLPTPYVGVVKWIMRLRGIATH